MNRRNFFKSLAMSAALIYCPRVLMPLAAVAVPITVWRWCRSYDLGTGELVEFRMRLSEDFTTRRDDRIRIYLGRRLEGPDYEEVSRFKFPLAALGNIDLDYDPRK